MAHAGAGGVLHLGGLQVEVRLGEGAERAGVVIVQVGDDELVDAASGDADQLEGGSGRVQHLPVAPRPAASSNPVSTRMVRCHCGSPTRNSPSVRAGVVVGIGVRKLSARSGSRRSAFDGQDLVGLGAHGFVLPLALLEARMAGSGAICHPAGPGRERNRDESVSLTRDMAAVGRGHG